jgi:hypothetical protein
MDPSVHAAPLFGAVSGSSYIPPAAFGVGNVTEAFPVDANTPFNVTERSKKVSFVLLFLFSSTLIFEIPACVCSCA